MQVFHIWPLVTERGGRPYLESLTAEVVSEAQLKQALPFASMFANRWPAPGCSEDPSPVRGGGEAGSRTRYPQERFVGAAQKRRLKVAWLCRLCLEDGSQKSLHLQWLQLVAEEVCRSQKGGVSEQPELPCPQRG